MLLLTARLLYFRSARCILPPRNYLDSGGATMILDWNAYQPDLTKAIPEFATLSPDSLKGYPTLPSATAKPSLRGEQIRQLISLAVAVTTRCDGCIPFHTDAALKAG